MTDLAPEAAAAHARLRAWGRSQLSIPDGELDAWCERAWWGLTAGEAMRDSLHNEEQRARALALIDPPDLGAIEEARKHGGLIVALAHLGPPKTAMHYFMDRGWPLMVWSHYGPGNMPQWMKQRPDTVFCEPFDPAERPAILVRSALHLRGGGVLMGAADAASGERFVDVQKFGASWRFSLGLPSLVRRLHVPVFLALALWNGTRIRINIHRLEPPDDQLAEEAWCKEWIMRYSDALDGVITTSPENLRFLRFIFSAPEWAAASKLHPPAGLDI
jgi:hypothetical protein